MTSRARVPGVSKRYGFTLIEILTAVMLAGLLSTLALAPVAMTVRRVVEAQSDYADMSALSRTVSFLGRDLFSAMRTAPTPIIIKDHEALGGNAEDILIFLSTSPASQGMSSGTLVYAVSEGGLLHGNVIPGLYRWIMPGVMPSEVNVETLNPEEAQLILPGVNEFSVEVPVNSRADDNKKDYSGELPAGIYIRIGRGVKSNEDNAGRRYESVISLP